MITLGNKPFEVCRPSKLRKDFISTDPIWRSGRRIEAVAGPRVRSWSRNKPGLYGIQVDIADKLKQIAICINKYRLVSPPEERSIPAVCPIEPLRIQPVQVPHDSRQVPARRLQHEVIMIWHAAVGEDDDLPPPECIG